MGLFSLIKQAFETVGDMKKLDSLQKELSSEFDKLDKEGKLPAEVKAAVDKLKSVEAKGTGTSSEESMAALKEFSETLEKYEDKLPDSIKAKIEKFGTVTDEVDKIMDNVEAEKEKLDADKK